MQTRLLVAVTVLGITALIAIVVLRIFAPDDTATIGQVIIFLGLVANILRSFANGEKLRSLHVDVNDRLSQLIIAEKSTSRAEGATEERERTK